MATFSILRYMHLAINSLITLVCVIKGTKGCVCGCKRRPSNENDLSTFPNLVNLRKYIINYKYSNIFLQLPRRVVPVNVSEENTVKFLRWSVLLRQLATFAKTLHLRYLREF